VALGNSLFAGGLKSNFKAYFICPQKAGVLIVVPVYPAENKLLK